MRLVAESAEHDVMNMTILNLYVRYTSRRSSGMHAKSRSTRPPHPWRQQEHPKKDLWLLVFRTWNSVLTLEILWLNI
jgi:hypothetical protein